MNRAFWPLVAFLALALVLGFGLYATRTRNDTNLVIVDSPLVGKPAPAFSLPDLMAAGQQVSGLTHQGSWRLVNFWGTWCAECQSENPVMLQIRQAGDVKVIGIDWKDNDQDARNWLQQFGNPYDTIGTDSAGNMAVDWGVYAAPENFLVDPNGRICRKQTGGLTWEIWTSKFRPLLKQPACDLT